MSRATFHVGHTLDVVRTLPDNSVDLVLTSPPFLALRSYLPADDPAKVHEIGQEANPAAFLDTLLALTAEWRRVLAPHGSIAIELGDTYSGSGGGGGDYLPGGAKEGQQNFAGAAATMRESNAAHWRLKAQHKDAWPLAKSLALVPELYRIGLAYGINPLTGQPSPAGRWRVRNVVRWHRPNPPVGALGDKYRPATTDMVVACTSDRRWFDLDAVREPGNPDAVGNKRSASSKSGALLNGGKGGSLGEYTAEMAAAGAPPLDTWIIPTEPYSGAHYATWPRALCVKPIESMCPRKVCTVCGEPSRRIVEEGEPVGRAGKRDAHLTDRLAAGGHMGNRNATTLGWTDCGCAADGSHWRNGVVLDPFGGSGTTGAVATGLGRDAILIDLDQRNAELARERIGLFLDVA